MSGRIAALALLTATAAASAGELVQVTASDADTRVARFPRDPGCRFLAVEGTGDLTPTAPGNADRSRELWRLGIADRSLRQATSSAGGVTCPRVSVGGDLVLSSREDLTPGAPGNADGSFETWIWDGATGETRQLTSSDRSSFFQTFADGERLAVVGSRGDLAPGAPGNADGTDEVFSFDVRRGTVVQATAAASASFARGVCPSGDCVFVESSADLVPGTPGNADGSREVFLVELGTGRIRQLTASAGDARFAGNDDRGRYVAVESSADLVPGGNSDGSLEVFTIDLRSGRVRQVTDSAGDAAFAAFLPRSRRLAVHARTDLAPGGDGDGSQEVFFVDARSGATRQVTRSAGDSALEDAGRGPHRWAIVTSTGDLASLHVDDGSGAVSETPDLYALRTADRRPRPAVRLTSGDAAPHFAGFGPGSRHAAFDTTADAVPGGNPDGSREVFLVTLSARARVRQATSSPLDSRAAGASPGVRIVAVESRADLTPGAPGNADGSLEVYLLRY